LIAGGCAGSGIFRSEWGNQRLSILAIESAAGISGASAWRMLKNLSSQPPQSPAWQQTETIVAVLYGVGVAISCH
jgi:hypothetical protein